MSRSSSSSRSEESKTITLSDKDLRAWFKFDRQALRWARRRYGPELGPRLWHDTFRPIDDDTVAAIASDVYENMRRQGVRDAQSYYASLRAGPKWHTWFAGPAIGRHGIFHCIGRWGWGWGCRPRTRCTGAARCASNARYVEFARATRADVLAVAERPEVYINK